MDNRPIGVFDSGLGGLSIVKEMLRLLPEEDIVFFGDTARLPYGTRSRETLQNFARQDMAFLLTHGVKMIVAACGTASSAITDEMAAALPVPYTGIITPTSQAACSASVSGKIGIIGTTATVKSGAFGRAIRAIRPDAQVVGNACPLFVPLVENGFIEEGNEVTRLVARQYLAPIQAEGVDTLILGCTHFPLLYNLINKELDYRLHLIDPGLATARYVQNFLSERDMLASRSGGGSQTYYVSEQTEAFTPTAEMFLGRPIGDNVKLTSVEGF